MDDTDANRTQLLRDEYKPNIDVLKYDPFHEKYDETNATPQNSQPSRKIAFLPHVFNFD